MKDRAYDGIFCNSEFVKCPYVLKVKDEWVCGVYHDTLTRTLHKLMRSPMCVKDEEKKRTYQSST